LLQPVRIIETRVFTDRPKRHHPIHGAAIDESVTEPFGESSRNRAFARARGAVDSDYMTNYEAIVIVGQVNRPEPPRSP
jgi:hypothetical protein